MTRFSPQTIRRPNSTFEGFDRVLTTEPVYDVVAEYKARADPNTDDAAAIQAALADVSMAGVGIVSFPPGTYKVNSALILTSNTHVRAQVPRTAFLKLGALPANPFAMFQAISTTTQISNIILEGLVLDGADTALLIAFGGVTDVLFRNCVFKNGGHLSGRGQINFTGGVGNYSATDCARIRFEDCEIGPSFDHGVAFAGSSDSGADVVRINGVTFDGCYVHDNSFSGICNTMTATRSVGNVEVRNCRFERNGLDASGGQQGHISDGGRTGWGGLEVHNSFIGQGGATCGGISSHGSRNVKIHHNTFDLNYGADIWPVALGDNSALDPELDWCRFVWVEDNYFTRSAAWDFDSSRDVFIRRNVFYRCYCNPIGTFGAHTRNFVEDNEFTECGLASTTTAQTAAIIAGNGFTVRRNTFRDDQTTKATLTTAIAGTNNDLQFFAWAGGTGGNSIRVRYLDPVANNAVLSVTVATLDITVNLATGSGGAITSTAAQVRAAFNASAASPLVDARLAAGNDGTGVVAAFAFTNLASGSAVAAPTQLIGVYAATGSESLGSGPTIVVDNDFGNMTTPMNMTGTYTRIIGAVQPWSSVPRVQTLDIIPLAVSTSQVVAADYEIAAGNVLELDTDALLEVL